MPYDDRYAPDQIEAMICIDLNEGTIDTIGVYTATGDLISVRIEGRDVPRAAVMAFVGPEAFARIRSLTFDELATLCAAAAQNNRSNHAFRG